MDILCLNKMVFYARHGVFPQERIVGQVYEIDLKLWLDLGPVGQSDRIEEGLSYADVYETVKNEMQKPSNTIEHVAERICLKIKSEYHTVKKVRICLRKENPPLGGQVGSAEVILER